MQKDFHFYVIYGIAREAGYRPKDAHTIAYSSQYVDDNTDRFHEIEIKGKRFSKKLEPIIGKGNKRFHLIMTQLADINLSNVTKPFNFNIQRYVYAPFHFIPAEYGISDKVIEKIEKRMGFYNPLATYQDCENAKELVREAIQSQDLYMIGISAHVYADTWSHSRFSGFQEKWNNVEKGLSLTKMLPDIGHAELKHAPDIISKGWTDKRFGEKVVNRDKALKACKGIFELICPTGRNWEEVRRDFEKIINARDYGKRVELILSKHQELKQYDADSWIQKAFQFKLGKGEFYSHLGPPSETQVIDESVYTTHQVIEIEPRNNFEKSDWYRFQIAAKRFLGSVLNKVEML